MYDLADLNCKAAGLDPLTADGHFKLSIRSWPGATIWRRRVSDSERADPRPYRRPWTELFERPHVVDRRVIGYMPRADRALRVGLLVNRAFDGGAKGDHQRDEDPAGDLPEYVSRAGHRGCVSNRFCGARA